MKNSIKIISLVALFFQGAFSAQESRMLSLSEAINHAMEHKADAEKARLNIKRGDAEIAEVKANAFPKITINNNTTYNPLLQEVIMPNFMNPTQNMRLTLGQRWQSTHMAQLQQVLFNQTVFTGLKAAKSTKEFYLINAQLTEEQIIEKVANAYYQVYQTEQMLQNLQDNLKIVEQTVKIIKGLYDAGLAKKIDYDRALVSSNNVKANQQQLINAVQLSKNALKFMVGMPMEQEIELPEQSFEPSVLISENSNSDFAERTELKVLKKQLELLNWKKKASESEYYPTATLIANYGWLGQGAKMPWWHGEKDKVYWSDIASIGLNVSIPIFNGFSTKSKIEKDKIDIEKAQADLREAQLGLDLAYKNAKTQLENSSITIKNQENNVKLAEEVMANTRANYQYGLATLNDILGAERDLADAKNNLTKSKLDYKLAEIELLKSQGKLRTLTEK
ncbi:TolC family protein [Riemerella anatipestifer]|uniref:TolC family protein n=1 Tax=Riemerella anatipestifer TaxID=34085 RepID=A0AAP6HFW9_RIEAN|nr:TolC family protein [Riemerella anatipestifer]MBT0549389.1 TolC family protein [Riemerella anatipestifer]MBT0555950.1 TolC family protein [Riemerella anatipestifer]MBT0560152.1 TolC family protein [Riemerella anatipestifer]MCD5968661.1 TolC family protein [Riemerella anatipestifer]MCO7355114.1 TolC family protein [Riemerella anatipestifer]